MPNVNPQTLLESVVRITQERTQDSLEASLVETMMDLLPARAIALLRVPEGNGDDQLEQVIHVIRGGEVTLGDHAGPALFVHPDEALRRALEDAQPVVEPCPEEGGLRVIFPIRVRNRVLRLVDIRCDRCGEGDNRLIEGLLRIYQNYLAVLDDNERDTLTGLLNRKTFDGRINRILENYVNRERLHNGDERRQHEAEGRHWLGVMDIDHFKRINDTHGHLYGDEVLLLVAQIMRRSFRAGDLLFRYGGEEFVVVLSPVSEADAASVFERFRQSVEDYDFPQVGRVTVSIGVVAIGAQDYPATVVGHADQALYYAKEHGRNRVCSYAELVAAGEISATTVSDDIELF